VRYTTLAIAMLLLAGCKIERADTCGSDSDCKMVGQDEWELCLPIWRSKAPRGSSSPDAISPYQSWNECRCVERHCAFQYAPELRAAAEKEAARWIREVRPDCVDGGVSVTRYQSGGALKEVRGFADCPGDDGGVRCIMTFGPAAEGALARTGDVACVPLAPGR
jgi:hypothetical protein